MIVSRSPSRATSNHSSGPEGQSGRGSDTSAPAASKTIEQQLTEPVRHESAIGSTRRDCDPDFVARRRHQQAYVDELAESDQQITVGRCGCGHERRRSVGAGSGQGPGRRARRHRAADRPRSEGAPRPRAAPERLTRRIAAPELPRRLVADSGHSCGRLVADHPIDSRKEREFVRANGPSLRTAKHLQRSQIPKISHPLR